uniref:Importin-11-like n=1 Tax=Hirondellea gigas TaxID=1518452 RepID=A0A2P2HZB5_9CRUS
MACMNGSDGGLPAVVCVLRNASCQQPELIKTAEQQLKQWEGQPGFYLTLLQAYLDQSLDSNIRWMAVLCFKNGVERYWRNVGEQKLLDDEKASIRSLLLGVCCKGEVMQQLTLQLAIVTGKVARQDCPNNWPQLLPTLLQLVTDNANTELVRSGALLTLHHVVKQISSRRLMHDRRKFQELSAKLFPEIHELLKIEVQLFLSSNELGVDMNIVASALRRAHYCFKILRKMAIHGFKVPTQVPQITEFYNNICEQVKVMLIFRKQHEGDALKVPAEKYTCLLMKSLLELLEHYPFCFLSYIRRALEIGTTFAFSDDERGIIFERFTIQCLNIIKCILDCHEYQVNKVLTETKSREALEAHEIKSEFFTHTVLQQICHRLITRYFILSRDDLDIWESDPEEYCTEVDGGDSWKFSLRPATEVLFRKMFHDYREAFRPVLLSLMTDGIQMIDPNNLQGILSKDAVYNAIGLTSFELVDDVDFDNWFTTHLVNELKEEHSNYRILRRRVIWLIGQWTDVRFDPKNRPLLYEACIHLLTNDPDFVVRYYTALTLKTAIDDFEFDRKCFMPYLTTVFALLFKLLTEARECDVKMQVLNVMSVMIEVIGSDIKGSAAPLIQFLPQLWDNNEQHSLLRCAILNTLTHVVNGMGSDCVNLQSFLLRVLNVSTDNKQDGHVYLIEDGLQLWLSVLENTPNYSNRSTTSAEHEQLLQLYKNILPVLDSSTEHMQSVTQITIAYVMLCPQPFLQRYGRELLDILGRQVNDLKSEALVLVLRILEVIIRTCNTDGVLLVRGVLASIVTGLVTDEEDQYPQIVSSHLSLLSRVLLVDYDSFLWILQQLSKSCESTEECVLTQLLRVWCSRMCLVTPDERRKLAALGLCRLVAVYHPAVLAVWGRAVEAIVEVVYDVINEDTNQDKLVISESDYGPCPPSYGSNSVAAAMFPGSSSDPSYLAAVAEDDDAPGPSSDVYNDPDMRHGEALVDEYPDMEHAKRRHALAKQDPVHNIHLKEYLGQALMEFQRVVPSETLCQLTADMSADTKTVMQEVTANAK